MTNDFPHLLRRVLAGEDLRADEMAATIGAIMDETLSTVRAAALLAALAAKGETVDEVVGAARAMRERSVRVEHGLPMVLDIVGTGGDGAGTINISTAAAFVVAGCGVPVAKHGNRAASSACGSADVLEALGVSIDRSPEASARALRHDGIAFLFAQRHHPAMRAVGPVRRELGVRTIFNVLGPLTNPAGAVVHSSDGLDEISGAAPSFVLQFGRDGAHGWTLDPAQFGIHASLEQIHGGDAQANARALQAILDGEASPRADVVALNAALALVVAGEAVDCEDGLAIQTGRARAALDALRRDRETELV